MTDIRDNPPPLPDTASLAMSGRSTEYIDGYESGFERCKAAMQGEIDDYEQELLRLKHDKDELLAANAELQAKIMAMEEQKPVAVHEGQELYWISGREADPETEGYLYLAAGAKP